MNLTTLIEQAAANRRLVKRADGTEVLSYMSGAVWESPIGRVVVHAHHSVRNPGSRSKHVRLTFDLDYRRIARAKLEELLKSV